LYVILKGSVDLFVDSRIRKLTNVKRIYKGSCFGAMSFFSQRLTETGA